MASGHVNRIKRPNTWLHRPMLQNVKKALANPEPSTHGTNKPTRPGSFRANLPEPTGSSSDSKGHERSCPAGRMDFIELPRRNLLGFVLTAAAGAIEKAIDNVESAAWSSLGLKAKGAKG
jgi:hypothetical protein